MERLVFTLILPWFMVWVDRSGVSDVLDLQPHLRSRSAVERQADMDSMPVIILLAVGFVRAFVLPCAQGKLGERIFCRRRQYSWFVNGITFAKLPFGSVVSWHLRLDSDAGL